MLTLVSDSGTRFSLLLGKEQFCFPDICPVGMVKPIDLLIINWMQQCEN